MYKIIIAFDGPKGSGKSYLAGYLRTIGFETKSFARPLKNALVEIFGHGEYSFDPELKEKKHPASDQSARILMTSAGDFFRSLNINCFRNKMSYDINLYGPSLICIDDLRYDNEAECLKEIAIENEYTLTIIRIEISERVKADHSSESGISDKYITHTIFNDKTKTADELLHSILVGKEGILNYANQAK